MSLVLTIITILTLVAATVQDVLTGKVKHWTWFPLFIFSVFMMAVNICLKLDELPGNWFVGYLLMLAIGLVVGGVMIVILRKYYGMGGADLMALLCLTIANAETPYLIIVVVAAGLLGMIAASMIPGLKDKKIRWMPFIFAGYLIGLLFCGWS